MSELAGSTSRNADIVPTLLEHLTDVGTVLASREEQLRELIGNGEVIADTLADRDTQLVQLIDAAAVLLETLTERRDELAAALGSGSAAVSQLSTLLTEHRASIDSLLTDAHVFLDRVGANLADINDGLGDAGPLLSLLAATRSASGGFDVSVEGIYVGNSQVDAVVGQLVALIEGLGLR
jgi:ABC-type transporter Mla subunit MlaD